MIFNVSDTLQRWTNDFLRARIHEGGGGGAAGEILDGVLFQSRAEGVGWTVGWVCGPSATSKVPEYDRFGVPKVEERENLRGVMGLLNRTY